MSISQPTPDSALTNNHDSLAPAAASNSPERPRRILVMRVLVWAGLTLAAYVGVVLAMMACEPMLVYHPVSARVYWNLPSDWPHEEIELPFCDGTTTHAVRMRWPHPHLPSEGVILFCHGNSGNLCSFVPRYRRVAEVLAMELVVFDYPGFGKSTGRPTEQGCYAAAHATYQHLVRTGTPAKQIVIIGESLGGGVAVELATQVDHRALVLINTFTSLPDVAQRMYPWMPVSLVMRNRFDSLSRIGGLTRPLFVAHAELDEIVPFVLGKQLYESATVPRAFFAMPGLTHCVPVSHEFAPALRRFLDTHAPRQPDSRR